MTDPVDKALKEKLDLLYSSGVPFGALENIPLGAPYDLEDPLVDSREIGDDPMAYHRANANRNNIKSAIDVSSPFVGVVLTDMKVSLNDEESEAFNINYAGYFSRAAMTGFCRVRVPTLHDGVLPLPDPSLTEEQNAGILSLYPIAIVLDKTQIGASELSAPNIRRGDIISVQAMDINRTTYEIKSLITKGTTTIIEAPINAIRSFSDNPVNFLGLDPDPAGDTTVGLQEPCSKLGNLGGTEGKPVEESYHTMKDFFPNAVYPVNNNRNISSAGGCPRASVRHSGEGVETHNGADIDGNIGDDIISPAYGIVRKVSRHFNADDVFQGQTMAEKYEGRPLPRDLVEIFHPKPNQIGLSYDDPEIQGDDEKLFTRYLHMSKVLVSVGDIVQLGQKIGELGNEGFSTGPHLHYEIQIAKSDYQVYKRGTPIPPFRVEPRVGTPVQAENYNPVAIAERIVGTSVSPDLFAESEITEADLYPEFYPPTSEDNI